MKTLLFIFALFISSSALAQTDQRAAPFRDFEKEIDAGMPPHIGLNRPAAEIMFDRQNHVTDKAAQQLLMRQNGTLEDNKLVISGRVNGTYIWEKTNTDGKFPILSRLPPTHTSGDHDGYSILNDASIGGTITLPYVTVYGQGEYTELNYPGQNPKEWRKYFITLGDLDVFPAYLTFGKKTVSFGNMDSYAPFTHGHNAHYFWAQNNDPLFELGYLDNGWHATASLIKNDRGRRVLSAPEGQDGYENFALNASKKFTIGDIHRFKLGAGYLRGTIYDSSLAYHPPDFGLDDREWSGAWNINGVYSIGSFDMMAELTRTMDEWAATGAHVHTLNLQGRYKDYVWRFPTTYSLMYSQGIQGDSSDEWERMDQFVAGVELKLHPNLSIGAEYLINSGFVPLIAPTVIADDGVVSHTFLSGIKITF
jgi:hypothetical protein